jgi:hypothetical protein
VLARVDLGVRPPHGALDHADAMIQVLLKIASNRSGGVVWQRTGSAYLLVDGRLAFAVHSAGPHVFDEVDHVGQDAMADALEEYGPAIAEALGRTQMPPDLADALRLLSEASDVDSREVALTGRSTIDRKSVIVLEDAAFGHIASYGRMSDDDLENSILKSWPHTRWSRQVRAAINVCLRSDEATSATLYQQIITHQRGRTRTSLLEASRLSGELLALCRDPLKRRFVEKWLTSIRDAAQCLHLHRQLERDRDLLRHRLSRTRNALVHGNPVHPVVIGTVRDLSHYRVNSAFTLALEMFSASGSFVEELHARADEYERLVGQLSQGVSMPGIWQARN